MDSLTSFKEIATCGICFELFNEENRWPRLLPCGHTFCHSCLEKILVQSPSCPTCKAEIQTLKADIIPVNYAVKSLMSVVNQDSNSKALNDAISITATDSVSLKLESEGFCTEHFIDKQLRCMDCESWICGICSSLKHKKCRTLLVKDAYKEFKDHISNKVEKELESRKSITDKMEQSLKDLEEQRNKLIEVIRKNEIELKECNKKINNLNSLKLESREFSEHLRQVQTEVETSINDAEISRVLNKFDDLLAQGNNCLTQLENVKLPPICPNTLEDLRKLSQEKKEVYVVDNENEPLYGKVTLKGEQIRISSFSPVKPEGLLFPFKEFLQRFNGSTDLPHMVYMMVKSVTSPVNIEVDVVIRTGGTSPAIRNFVLLFSGLKRRTYKGTKLYKDGTGYALEKDLPPVVEGLICNYINVQSRGGFVLVDYTTKSKFCIEFCDRNVFGLPVGVVISGLEEVLQLYNCNKSIIIEDCGLVIQMYPNPGGGIY